LPCPLCAQRCTSEPLEYPTVRHRDAMLKRLLFLVLLLMLGSSSVLAEVDTDSPVPEGDAMDEPAEADEVAASEEPEVAMDVPAEASEPEAEAEEPEEPEPEPAPEPPKPKPAASFASKPSVVKRKTASSPAIWRSVQRQVEIASPAVKVGVGLLSLATARLLVGSAPVAPKRRAPRPVVPAEVPAAPATPKRDVYHAPNATWLDKKIDIFIDWLRCKLGV